MSTIFKTDNLKSFFGSANKNIAQPFANAEQVIWKYNQAIAHNSLTQQGWERILAQSDDGLKAYLTSIKGTTATTTAYTATLNSNFAGFKNVSDGITQYNALASKGATEQQAFSNAVAATNTSFGKYLAGLNGGKASLTGYGVSLVGATVKTIGLTAASMALNAAVSMGVSVIITGLISAFTAWINKSEEITQKAQEAADKINSINDNLKTNTETVENAKRRYAELAQEVENLGKTNQSRGSLNNEEYEEFLDLSNQLAGVFPTLTKGYDENGNAILDLSGDVNTIVGSLDDLIKKEQELANQKIMEEFPDVFSGFTQDLKNAKQEVKSAQSEFDKINNAYQDLASGGMTSQSFDTQGNGWFTNANGEKVTVTLAEYISNLEALGIAYEKTNIMVKNQFGGDQLSGYLVEATGDINTAFTSKLETARNNLKYAKQQLEGEASSINQYLNTWLQTEFSYNQIEDAGLQDAIQQTLFNFDWDSLPDNIDKNDWAEVSEYLRKNVLFAINNVQDNPEISKALSDLFTNQELSPEQKNNLIKQIQDYFGKDNPISIFLQPQFEENETTQKNIDKAIADAQKKFDKVDWNKYFEEQSINTQEEVDKWNEVTEGAKTAAEAMDMWANAGKNANKMTVSLEDVTKTLSTLQGKYNELKSAQDEYNSTGAISADTMQKLVDNDLLQYLDFSSGKLQINTDALLAEGEAAKVAAIQNLQKAMAEDLAAVAAGRDGEASTLAQTAIAGLGNNAETAGNQAETAAGQLAGFAVAAEAAKKGAEGNLGEGVNVDDYRAKADAIISAYTSAANSIGNITIASPKSSGSSSSSGKSGGSTKENDPKKEAEEQAQKELEALKAGLEARNQIIEKYKESIDITDFGLDIAEEKDFALRTDLLNSKLSQVTAYGQAMRKEFERVSNIVPKTADQAEALASQLSTLGSNMRNNVKTLRETQIAIQKLSIDAVTMSAKDNLDDMQTTLNRLEKRIELLNGDNKNDYKYTNKILNMETLLPTNADMTSRRKNRSRADQSVIKTEEETQNVLNDMFREQIKLNDNLREEERQALLADMETMRNDMVINMQNASSDYVNYGNEVINTTKAYTKTVTDTVNSMNLVLPKPDTSKFAEACNEVEKMILNLGKGVSYEITPKSDGRGGGDAASLLRGNKKTIIKNVADGQLGVPYLWGGVTPGAGLDCSGLTQYVYRSVGVNIPRIADDQLKSGVGTRVDTRNLQVGDQLFFSEDGKTASHTGIYVGNGMMIHAPSTGDVVKYSNINSEYYQSRLMGAKRYALGTPSSSSEIALVGDDKEGKLNKIRPELIVGKDGVRLAGQNGAEFVSLESGDQVIPYEKTRQILQRSDVSTPRYASGTVSPGAIAAYIKQNYPEVTDAAIAGLLGNIEQESSFVVDAKIIEAYGGGDNTPTARRGLFQLDDKRVPGWSNIVQNGTWQQQIDRAFVNARYENSGEGSLSEYNAWDRVLTNTNLSPTEAAKLWDDLFERSDGKSRDIRATNAEKYYTNLLNGTLENTSALNDNTSALKEELDPVKQAVEEINKFSESFEADIKKLITPVRVKEKELAETEDMTKGDKQFELFKLYLPVATEAAKNGTAKFSELLAQYNQYLADVDNKVKDYEQDIVDAYEDGLAEIKDSVYDVEKAVVEVKNNLIEAAEKRNDRIDSYISARNFYGDWAEYGDTEYKAIERKIKEYDKLLQEGVITQRQYNEAIEPLKQDEVSLLKNEISSALDRRIEEIDFQSSKLSSKQTLLQAHYDIINSIAEQQHTINKELETSKSMYEYLDENTRKLLFNQEDYNRLTSELNSINAEAIKLQDRYLKDISNAKKEDLDQITSKYQMQYDMLMKQYEVEKARLEVTKKQQQLNNVLKERNVRMFINGQWVWVAKTQDVQNAKAELADAKFQEQQAKNSNLQQKSLNKLQTSQDRNQTQINYIESTKDRVSGSDVRSMAEILEDIGKSQFPEVRNILSRIIGTSGDGKESYKKNESKQNDQALQELLKNGVITQEQYDEMKKASNSQYDTDYMDKIHHALSEEEVRKYNTLRNEKIDNLGLPEKMKLSPEGAIKSWKDYLMSNDFLQQIYEAKSPEEAKKINEFRNAKIYAWDLDAKEYTPADIEVEWESNLKNTDYSQKIRDAKTLEEALKWNALRSVKIDRFNMNEDKFADTYVEEIFNTKEQLKDNVQYWEEAEEILRNNAEDVNGVLLSLLEKSIPNFKTALENSSQEIINWTKSIINNQTSASDTSNEVSAEPINQYASGTKYTMPGRAELGENGAETFFSRHGEYVPIPDPMFANLPSGGVVFNQEQMSNVRKLWDLANSNILQYSKYMRKPQPQSIDKSVDNSVNINGMKVDTNNSREFVEALRRFVNIH